MHVAGTLLQDEHVVVEESPLIITYPLHPGDHRGLGTRNHLGNSPEIIMVAHKKTKDGSQGRTINERVAVGDVYGFDREPSYPRYNPWVMVSPHREHAIEVLAAVSCKGSKHPGELMIKCVP